VNPLASEQRFPVLGGALALLSVRALVGAVLVLLVVPVSVDDYFRVFHALWWWDNISFTSSHEWLPGHSYVYGPLVGITGSTTLAPRVLTLVLQLTTGAVLLVDRSQSRAVRWLAAVWLLCSPLSLVLGTVPLTESLFTLLVVTGIVALGRFLKRGKSPYLLLAAVGYLGASMVRYEAWILLPVFTAFALSKPPERYFALANRALAFLPWIYPIVWTLLLWGLHGEPFTYLAIVREDHFGRGDLLAEIGTVNGAFTLGAAILSLAVLAIAATAALRRQRPLADLLWEAHLLAAVFFVGAVLVTGNVPSQLSLRLLFPLLALSSVPLARLLAARVASRGRLLAIGVGTAVALLAVGMASALALPVGVREENLRAGRYLRSAFTSGELGAEDHALVEHELPDAAAVLIYSEQPARVHIDRLGGSCPARLLGTRDLVCPVEPWSADVRLALVRSADAARSLELRRWQLGDTFGDWAAYLRPDDGERLGADLGPP
jgi:hypothetical protein